MTTKQLTIVSPSSSGVTSWTRSLHDDNDQARRPRQQRRKRKDKRSQTIDLEGQNWVEVGAQEPRCGRPRRERRLRNNRGIRYWVEVIHTMLLRMCHCVINFVYISSKFFRAPITSCPVLVFCPKNTQVQLYVHTSTGIPASLLPSPGLNFLCTATT